jgi:uncharacterized protein
MVLSTEYIKQVITGFFEKKPVKRVWLFGSYARGDADENSDVDVLVDIDYVPGIASEYITWKDELTDRLKKNVDILSAGWESKYIKPFIDEDKLIVYER